MFLSITANEIMLILFIELGSLCLRRDKPTTHVPRLSIFHTKMDGVCTRIDLLPHKVPVEVVRLWTDYVLFPWGGGWGQDSDCLPLFCHSHTLGQLFLSYR